MQMVNHNPLGEESLLLIPCCASKQTGGVKRSEADPLADVMSETSYSLIIQNRSKLLDQVQNTNKYISGKKLKNTSIQKGSDFGEGDLTGRYLPAIKRYIGNLYTSHNKVVEAVNDQANAAGQPRLLILSALYGPLHPDSFIQDYNLQMSDSPAYTLWRNAFPEILESYVDSLGIRDIHLLVGSSTAYFKVAKVATNRLKANDKLDHIYQYDVIKGNSYHTPHNHGLLLLQMLTQRTNLNFTKSIAVKEL